MAERIYRDPVHNVISLDESKPQDHLLIQLIDTPEFQRLRRIRQLGLALYTYQGAEHSRFSHSLGVLHLMRRILSILSQRYPIDEQTCFVAQCAALLHDIGHGPLSHVIEAVLGYKHETWTAQIISSEGSEINRLLRNADPDLPAKIVSVLEHRFKPHFVSQLVSSQMDVDRFDYLLRDSLMTGAKYGFYDLEWIIHALEVDPVHDRVYVAAKGLFAVEEYLQARYYMYRQVYFHRNLRAAEVVVRCLIRRAMELATANELKFTVPESVMAKVLRQSPLSTEEYLEFDDHDLMFHIKQWVRESDPILSDLAKRFLHRRMFKSLDLTFSGELNRELIDRTRELVEKAGLDPRYYFAVDRATDIPYFGPYSPETSGPKSRIYVEVPSRSQKFKEITEVSQVVRGLRRFHIDRICFPEEVSDKIHDLLKAKPYRKESVVGSRRSRTRKGKHRSTG